jgi:hypothetical protein
MASPEAIPPAEQTPEPSPLSISVTVTRMDMFRFGLYATIRVRLFPLLCLIGIGAGLWGFWNNPTRPDNSLFFAIVVVFNVLLWMVIWTVFVVLIAVINTLVFSSVPGILGAHSFEIRDAGLFESTDANETLQRWHAVRKVVRTRRHLFVLIGPHLVLAHVIPLRAFPDAAAADAFYCELQLRLQNKAR